MWIPPHRRLVHLLVFVALVVLGIVVVVEWRPLGDSTTAATEWTVVDISSDQRTLILQYASEGCESDDGRASVRETSDAVAFTVTHSVPRGTASLTCTADLRLPELRVRLKRPVAGRRIDGGDVTARLFIPGEMPRLIGYSPADAMGSPGTSPAA